MNLKQSVAGELPEKNGDKLMQTNHSSEGFDNPTRFREEWDKQTEAK